MKRLIFLTAIVVAWTAAMAADVDLVTAQNVARSFMAKQVSNGRLRAPAISNLTLAKAEASVFNPKAVDYYIFNADKSYVVVAGDDEAPEILMYGEEGKLDLNNIPPAMQWLLNKYKYQIDGLKAGTLKANGYVPRMATAVAPMVTANWDQSAPYNNQCPTSGSNHAVTGCPATSLAMCYYKWKWPKTLPACAKINASSDYYGSYLAAPALSERTADWSNIIDEYTGPTNYSSTSAQKDAVAWLMRYAGQSIPNYQYSTSASGATDPDIYQGVLNMGYTDARLLTLTSGRPGYNQRYTDARWNEMMLAELYAGRPIEYLASDPSSGGHAFNVFGCNASGQYYVNWGWSGSSNGYCTLHNFTTATGSTGESGSYTFNYGEAMIIGIQPPAGALDPSLNVGVTSLTILPGKTKIIQIKGSYLTDDVVLTLNDPSNVFSLSVDGVNQSLNAMIRTSSGSITIPAANISESTPAIVRLTFKSGYDGEYTGSLSVASQGAETKTISLKGTSDDGGTASDAYLNIAKYATIDDAGWARDATNYVTKFYEYTEYPNDGVAWLTMPVFGAWTGYRYPSNQGPQKWITANTATNVSYSDVGSVTTAWSATGIYKGSSAYFNGKTTRRFGNTSTNGRTEYAVTFCVTNVTGVKLKGKNNNASLTSYPTTLKVFECREESDGTLTNVTQVENLSNTTRNQEFEFDVTGLEAGKIYRVVAGLYRANFAEIGFQTQLPSLKAEPSSLSFFAKQPGETVNKSFTLKGVKLSGDVTATVSGASGVFTAPATINEEDAISSNGTTVNVSFNAPETGTYNGTLTLTCGSLTATVALNGQCGVPDGYSRVTLTAADVWGDGTGYQMLLDADHNTYGTTIPTQGGLTTSGNASAATYNEFEYKIPENADGSLTTTNIVTNNNSVTILIPAGTYDWVITNPTPGDRMWIASANGNVGGRYDDFVFESGKNYEFIVSLDGTNDRVDVNPITTPTELIADPGSTMADISWTPGENNESWNLRWRPYVEIEMESILWDLTLDNYQTQMAEFSVYDADGDDDIWGLVYSNDEQTDVCLASWSYDPETESDLTPDNWLFTPEVELGGTLKFKSALRLSGWPDKLGVYVLPTGDDNYYKLGDIVPDAVYPSFGEYEFDLSEFEGMGQIAFRHYESDGNVAILLDDIEISYPVGEGKPAWNYEYDIENTPDFTITGLTPETTYEVQVQGVNDFGISDWTASTLFTTQPLATGTLAEMVADNTLSPGLEYAFDYTDAAGDYLLVVKMSEDGKTLFCKDNGAFANKAQKENGQIDYLLEDKTINIVYNLPGSYDQSNWVALTLDPESDLEFNIQMVGCYLNNVIGRIVSLDNPQLRLIAVPETGDAVSTPYLDGTPNVFIPSNFGATTSQVIGENNFFFMPPKPMEVARVTWALWNGEYFTEIPKTGTMNPYGLTGAFTVNNKYLTLAPSLEVGDAYTFVAAIVRNNVAPSGARRNVKDVNDPSGLYEVYPLTNPESIGTAGGGTVTGITNINANAKEVKEVRYIDITGRVSKTPWRGVNIVETIYKDGSKSSKKVRF